MNIEQLVKMANDIGNFFDAEPRHEDAVNGIAEHLNRYWAPRMRSQLMGYAADHGIGLKASVREALSKVKSPAS